MAAQTFKLYLYGIEITQTMAMTLGESRGCNLNCVKACS